MRSIAREISSVCADGFFPDRQFIKNILPELSLIPSKRLGQSFLIDRGAAKRIVDALELKPQDVVLEIGPGLAALTGMLLGQCQRIVVIDFDSKLVQYLKRRFSDCSQLSILHADILKVDIKSLLEGLSSKISSPGCLKVLGNLPYKISTQILFQFLECSIHPERMIFAFQWEVAKRLIAEPKSKDYGALTLITQFYAQVQKVMQIKKQSFYPEPGVDTGILTFIFRSLDLGLERGSEKFLFQIIKQGFSKRRKTLRNALTSSVKFPYTGGQIEEALSRSGFSLQTRAEALTLFDMAKFLKALHEG